MPKAKSRPPGRRIAYAFICLLLVGAIGCVVFFTGRAYTGRDFGIKTAVSPHDANHNGVDDYRDLLLGARQDAQSLPQYKSAYYEGGYPPENEGVCTDLVWRAFRSAGYDLKTLVDRDIAAHTELYPRTQGNPDPNIDFRRVKNLKVFFDRHATPYSLNPYEIAQWQPGDIVIFGEDYIHIAIVSELRNSRGIPYLLHNAGQPVREEDALLQWANRHPITGHYRWENP